uniref:Cytochrome b n=1 Tax=Opisthorchis sp. BD-2013 TaxID=1986351 RepID=A0A2H4RAA8_9TREM|nr:cytochrome b [Opisthorchis sp. BD-2013]ATY46009.1 cytochrome b [Opisthorchis sp. BD-2013]ATY46010.1 cytochrome b [Opisthorchis sp. BD-2013]ATY46011.1 cytochrome b [Opisthorchis sp. BD-2013]ATY46012.1 cytochrome b [Opisthorchis sp. BD-2013]
MLSVIYANVVDLPTNVSLNYFWCGGFMISVFLVLQVVSGIILSLLYVADVGMSFGHVLGFVGEGLFIWFVRYLHIWGVTFIFILFLFHMGRSFYYSSYSKLGVWNVGFVLYILMMIEAFLGYILPWHQMSYWAATVLTSILQSVPVVGASLYSFIVGGFGVTNVTLVRVFSAHICLAFVILGFSVVHIFYLHKSGSNNPLSVSGGYSDVVLFHSYFTLKDGLVFVFLVFVLSLFMLVSPDLVLDVESYIQADPLVTPVSIKPEWYFLAFYAMLRCVESKVGGLILVLVFLFLMWLPSFNGSCVYSVLRQFIFWAACSVYFLLSYLGSCHPEFPFVFISKVSSVLIVLFLMLFKGLWLVPYSSGVPVVVY